MEPIRGPLDYHRYPPRNRHRTNSQNDTSSQHTMPNKTPNLQPAQPSTTPRASTGQTPASGAPAPGGSPRFAAPGQTAVKASGTPVPPQRVLRRPNQREEEEQRRQYQMANAQDSSRPVQPLYQVPTQMGALDDEDEDEPVVPRRRKTQRRIRHAATHPAPAQNDVIMRHRIPPHSVPHSLEDQSDTTDEAAAHLPHRIRRKRQASLFFSRGRRKRLGPHQAFENAMEPPPTTTPARPPRRPFWLWVRRGVSLLLVVGCAELLFAALTSPRMAVREVHISGLKVTSEAAVQPVAMSLVGQNWIRAHVREAARKVAALPSIRSAQVVRVLSWPPRLELQVEERQPFARVGGGGDWWVVDEAGMPFRHATPADRGLYAVTAPTLQPSLGEPLPATAWRPVVEFATALSRESQQGHDWTLRRIYFDKQGFASLRLAGGSNDQILVRLGNNRWPDKLQRAREALAYFEATGRHAVALNLISYSRPTWTPRLASSPTESAVSSRSQEPQASAAQPDIEDASSDAHAQHHAEPATPPATTADNA